ncbi:S-adenosyl-L-methionine-dependent methyltransferase [Ochromonadaceae sp. CCMP2298]|nr:S-adenosyl-L-methionine-dependent methyltransferase [Ochromonadaceae sp. CCMP2298]|mmetsp:Transcript_4918/g.10929  ORF Transcript_4918/g.10929 Transcript_4918/m.10929 type:complete len:204 (-) Transcript_4918:50-661(-)
MADFGNPSYWDERYSADENHYDWYQDFTTLEKYISPHVKNIPDFEILVAGCGNSKFSASLYDKGYRNITNIDISTVVINQMSDAYADRNEMEFTVMDARNMEFIPDQCFDLIIDKALFDAVICSENNLKDIESLLKEMHRALKLGGVYLLVSHGAPNNRINHIKRYIDVDIDVVKLPKPPLNGVDEQGEAKFHFLYVLTKPAN